MPQKAVAASGSVGVSGAISTLIIAIWWPQADATIAVALTTVVGAALAFLGAYFPKFEGEVK